MVTLTMKKPKKTCNDVNCPFHGNLHVRGRIFEGIVISAKMDKTVVLRRDYQFYIPKYRRYERRHSHISAHNPPCLGVIEDEKVLIAECRPISKTVSFVVIERIGDD